MNSQTWEFWVDVGGTFTDCFAHPPDAALRRHKLLSSAVTKGAAGAGSGNGHVVDPARIADPSGFWSGWSIALLDNAGQLIAQSRVQEFDVRRGVLILENAQLAVSVGQQYELLPDEPAPVVAIRYLLGLQRTDQIPPLKLKLGTTRATNALITRSGARTALVTTRGFADVLTIGYQNRPQLFELTIRKPPPLICCSVEINERISADGEVLLAPTATQIDEQLAQLKQQGIESLAVCLLHAVANPTHELLIGQLARRHGFSEVSLSHQAAPLVKFVSRGDTTTANAYLNPVLRGYLEDLSGRLPGSDIKVLTSAGGLIGAASLHAKDAVLSGPAGGVVGYSRVARAAGFSRSIGFDMGGTSTDVSRFDGRFEREFETEKAGVRLVTPMMAIETVAAGGGSICRFDGAKLVVGPQSAGADPGPACYGRGGPLTITDCNYFLGCVPAARFPFPLDRTAVQRRLQAVANEVQSSAGQHYELSKLADGFIRVANATMARAIRAVSTAKGYDVRDYPLVSFGGAGGQHACAIARELGIRQVLCPPDAGLLSAYGIGLADIVRHQVAGIYQRLTAQSLREAAAIFASFADTGVQQVLAEGIPRERIAIQRTLQLRYEGVEASLPIDEPAGGDYAQSFINEHRRLFGYVHDQRPIEIVSALVEVTGRVAPALPESLAIDPKPRSTTTTTPVVVDGEAAEIRLIDASDLAPGDRFTGPAIIAASTSTVLVDPLWQADVLSQGDLLLTDTAPPTTQTATTVSDPVTLEIFNHLFAGIADQMGYTLRATSTSVNVKERLDYSCAIFDAAGQLIATAAHIPVHLGAMGLTVRAVISEYSAINPGDVFITNDPYRGGSHLPDVTVITPIHDAAGQLLFFSASRAHHAEIGGSAPGSMPPSSKNLADEGVLIGLMKLVDAGSARFDNLETLLNSAPFPSRDAKSNLADITAQVAANARGAAELLSLADRYTLPVVQAQMHHIRIAAEQKVRRALAKIDNGVYRRIEYLDDGSPIAVTFTISDDTATVDFTGTAPEQPNNFNANRAIVTAAVLYVLRCLIADDVPLNEGMLAPVDIILPECMLNPPRRLAPGDCAAVAAGNVETSQRIVDALLGALGLAAASQGTMNNLLFGDATFGYYETICGGSGATADGPGAHAVHTHMTNTRLTDVEVLERRYPVRVHEFAIRKGSGGSGQNPGGDGVLRELAFLRPLELSIISQRRGEYPPYGIAGGQPGAIGRNTLIRVDGSTIDLGGIAQISVAIGDRLRFETPGGGGWGTPRQSK